MKSGYFKNINNTNYLRKKMYIIKSTNTIKYINIEIKYKIYLISSLK